MTDFEKYIYNCYITTTRRVKNKPSRTRENFDHFESDPKYLHVKRIAILCSKHKEIDIDLYFEAPYRIYKDVEFFDLSYFASLRAIKAYTLYKKQLQNTDPDLLIDSVKKSLLFITKFCIENKIQLIDYINITNGTTPTWVEHVKCNSIIPYSLMELNGLYTSINKLTPEEQDLFLGAFGTNYLHYRDRYNNCKKLKPFLIQTTFKLKNTIFNHLQNKK